MEKRRAVWIGLGAVLLSLDLMRVTCGQLVVSGNENKLELTSGVPQAVASAAPDSITLLDFATFPPRVRHVIGIPNSVLGPPSNIAIAANGRRALLADSIRLDSEAKPDPWKPTRDLHWIDLESSTPRILATVEVGLQPSGLSIDPTGAYALVANRGDGSVSQIDLRTDQPRLVRTVAVCPAEHSLSDVAIDPQGRFALASAQKGGYLVVLEGLDGDLRLRDHKVSACGQPYRVVITPDGSFGLTAGQGFSANGIDEDALTIVDLRVNPIRTVDYVPLGAVPESIEISPDGHWLAAVLMAGSNYPDSDPRHTDHGELVLLEREKDTFQLVQRHPVGRIPEGVAFTGDGRYLLVQCHADREIWIFEVSPQGIRDTGQRVPVPGMPSSLRAAP